MWQRGLYSITWHLNVDMRITSQQACIMQLSARVDLRGMRLMEFLLIILYLACIYTVGVLFSILCEYVIEPFYLEKKNNRHEIHVKKTPHPHIENTLRHRMFISLGHPNNFTALSFGPLYPENLFAAKMCPQCV